MQLMKLLYVSVKLLKCILFLLQCSISILSYSVFKSWSLVFIVRWLKVLNKLYYHCVLFSPPVSPSGERVTYSKSHITKMWWCSRCPVIYIESCDTASDWRVNSSILWLHAHYTGQTRTTMGQLCTALWDSQSRPVVIQPEFKPGCL